RHVLAQAFLQSANQWRATVLYAAPFHFALWAREQSALALTSLRLAISTTCALPGEVAEDFRRRFGQSLVQALGIIELGLVSVNVDDPVDRPGSVGRPLPDHRLRILDPDEEGLGEIAVSGPGFLDAYAVPWIPRHQVLSDGWFRTGDIGRLDGE